MSATPDSRARSAALAYLAKVAVLAAAYYGAARFGLSLAYENTSITAVWPPTGIALATLVLWGYRYWPGVALGAFLANSLAGTGTPLLTVLGISAGNTLEALVGAFLLLRVLRFRPSLERRRDVVALVLAAVASTAVSATLGVASLWAGGATEASELASAWRLWWLGDLGGDLVVAPVLFVLATGVHLSREPRRIAEASALLVSLVTIGVLVFSHANQRPFLVFPLLIWAALRFGQRGAAGASVLLGGLAVWFTTRNSGPFIQETADASLLLTTTFACVASTTGLFLAAVMSERSRAHERLRRGRDELGKRVRDRTAELDHAQTLAHIGSWHWDVKADVVSWSDELFRIYGLEPQSAEVAYESFLELVHPEDRGLVEEAVRRSYETGAPFAFDHRIVRPDGSIRWLHGRGEVEMGESGPLAMRGTGQDITDRREGEEHFRSIVDTANDAFVAIDSSGRIRDWNHAAELAFGWPSEEVLGRQLAETIIPSAHRDAHRRGLQHFLDTGEGPILNRRLELTALHREGHEVPVELTVWPVRSGNEWSFNAFLRDVSERVEAEEELRQTTEHYRSIVESASGAFVEIGADGLIVTWNREAEALFGTPRHEAIGRAYVDLTVPSRYRKQHRAVLRRLVEGGSESLFHKRVELTALRTDGNEFPVEVTIWPTEVRKSLHLNAFVHDISERKWAEEERARLLAAERQARADAEAASKTLRQLEGISGALSFLTVDDLRRELLERTREILDADVAALLTCDEERGTQVERWATGLADTREEDAVAVDGDLADAITAERRPVIVDGVDRVAAYNPLLHEKGVRSVLGVPMLGDETNDVRSVLQVGTLEPRTYTADDVRLLELVADRATLAIVRAQLYESERGAAETFQRSLLPTLPDLPGIDVAARYVPGGTGLEIGGDWYDVIALPEGAIGLAIGDVVGRGLEAAAVMGQMRNALRAYALEGFRPAAVLERLNRLVAHAAPGEMATMVYACFDPATGALRFVRAGHPSPLIVSPDGAARYLEGGVTFPVGARGVRKEREGHAVVHPGSTLLFFTDGLVERRGAPISEGLDRLKRAASSGPGGLEELCDHVLAACASHDTRTDDLALLVVRPTPALVAGRLELDLPADPDVLAPLRAMLGRWLEQVGVGGHDAFAITLACCEASANAIEHAYGPGHATFRVEAALDGEDAVLRIRDSGRWRGPRGRNRGRGLTLMRAFMDGVELAATPDGTEVCLRRTIREVAAP